MGHTEEEREQQKEYLSQPGFLAHDDGRLGIAKLSPDKLSPLKRREAERAQDLERRNFELKNGTLKRHEEIPAGTSTKWDTYQLVTGINNINKGRIKKRAISKLVI